MAPLPVTSRCRTVPREPHDIIPGRGPALRMIGTPGTLREPRRMCGDADQREGAGVERITLAFTGPDSHTLVREPGAGSVTVGPAGARIAPDLIVDVDD